MDYARTIRLDLPYDQAVPKVKEAFKEQGFGTLTEIDVTATLKEKLGQDMEDYVILGACNPQLAHRALDIEREIGLLLPCNVVVRSTEGGTTLVQALDPNVMVTVPERPQMQPIAEEASTRVQAALDTLRTTTPR
ncbi:MAG TPA: ABC transporter ATP-binding protein [Streptomyces sp.]|nr:ABC transporter ATP-binding protein [Streptomyces sp.]